jgi:hypothetical protein
MKMLQLTCLILFLTACDNTATNEPCYMTVSILCDITDYHALQPNADATLAMFDLSDNKDHAVHFRYAEITDKILVPAVDLYLPDAVTGEKKNRNSEPLFREKAIVRFYDTVRKTLVVANAKKDSVTLDHSECFKMICTELNVLSQQKSTHKILWLFSNLQENSAILSVFNGNTKQLIHDNPGAIERLFEQTHLLPQNLDQITIVFSYLPTNREDDQSFNAMVQVYKKLLVKHGAKVIIHATNKFG